MALRDLDIWHPQDSRARQASKPTRTGWRLSRRVDRTCQNPQERAQSASSGEDREEEKAETLVEKSGTGPCEMQNFLSKCTPGSPNTSHPRWSLVPSPLGRSVSLTVQHGFALFPRSPLPERSQTASPCQGLVRAGMHGNEFVARPPLVPPACPRRPLQSRFASTTDEEQDLSDTGGGSEESA